LCCITGGKALELKGRTNARTKQEDSQKKEHTSKRRIKRSTKPIIKRCEEREHTRKGETGAKRVEKEAKTRTREREQEGDQRKRNGR